MIAEAQKDKSLPKTSPPHTQSNSSLLFNTVILLESQGKITIMKYLPTKDISYNVISVINHPICSIK